MKKKIAVLILFFVFSSIALAASENGWTRPVSKGSMQTIIGGNGTSDGNNYTTGLTYTNNSINLTLILSRLGMTDLSVTFPLLSGLQGPKGDQGIPGIPGTNGTNGLNGSQGPAGVPGANGTNGVNGSTPNITSVTWNGGNFTMTWTTGYSFISPNLTGPAGPQGTQGTQGNPGNNGVNGVNGSNCNLTNIVWNAGNISLNWTCAGIINGPNLTGPQGIQGLAGAAGTNGTSGMINLSILKNNVVFGVGFLSINFNNGWANLVQDGTKLNITFNYSDAENKTKVSCANITGAASNLCTITSGGGGVALATTTCSGTDKVSGINNVTGAVTCTTDQTGAGSTDVYKRQSRDVTNANVSLWNATRMNFALATTTNYTLSCDLLFTANAATTGQAINLSYSGTAKNIKIVYLTWSSAVAPVSFSATSFGTALVGTGSAAAVININHIIADFETTGAGNLNLSIRTEVGTNPTTLEQGSGCNLKTHTGGGD